MPSFSSGSNLFKAGEYFGVGSIANVGKIILKHKASKLLIVSGKSSYIGSGTKVKLDAQTKGCTCTVVSDFEVNPKYDDIIRVGIKLKNEAFDLVIAAGGGSVIDFAKCLNVYISTQDEDGSNGIRSPSLLKGGYIPMIAIPTTAGTGSEATHFAVAYVDSEKTSVADPLLAPNYVIVDPSLSFSSPPYLTACCAFDALCQAIESFWSNGASSESKRYAEEAIVLIKDNIIDAVQKNCEKARSNLSLGAFLAGKAINISKTTGPHALSYALTSAFQIPHGHCVAMTLGHFFCLNEDSKSSAFNSGKITFRQHKKNMREIRTLLNWEDVTDIQTAWIELMQNCGLSSKLLRPDIFSSTAKELSKTVDSDRLSNHPVKVSSKTVEYIYSQVLI